MGKNSIMKDFSKSYFTEQCVEGGTAFSFKIKQKLHSEQTPYQKIEIFETQTFGRLMLIDGFVMLTTRDNFLYHEMMSHPALFTHPNPKNIVIIGGGDCGTLKEVLKHPEIESAWQIDIDERVTRLSEKYFPELCTANNDPRAHFYFGDGVRWMKEASPASVDVIIVDSTDPVGPGEGLFTPQFYVDCYLALRENGIVVHQSESPLFHLDSIIKPMHQKLRRAGFGEVQTLQFPQPCYPSGWWTATMAVKNGSIQAFRTQAALAKVFDTLYYNHDIHQASCAQPSFMKAALADVETDE
jgi:spermidine synthase